jgi:hypothetical protein
MNMQFVALSALAALAGASVASASSSPVVGGSGIVVAYSAQDVQFCNGPMTLALTPEPPRCGDAIRVTGVDLSRLKDRVSRHGRTWGRAYLMGTFRNGMLTVVRQGPPRPAVSSGPSLREPPCAAPRGGWPNGPASASASRALDAYRARFPADVVSVAIFHPASGLSVMTIASTNPARTRAILSSPFRGRLCIVRSRYRAAVVRSAMASLTALLRRSSSPSGRYEMTGVGLTVSEQGQPRVLVEALVETSGLRRVVASKPAGLVEVVPWLRPVLSGGSLWIAQTGIRRLSCSRAASCSPTSGTVETGDPPRASSSIRAQACR